MLDNVKAVAGECGGRFRLLGVCECKRKREKEREREREREKERERVRVLGQCCCADGVGVGWCGVYVVTTCVCGHRDTPCWMGSVLLSCFVLGYCMLTFTCVCMCGCACVCVVCGCVCVGVYTG